MVDAPQRKENGAFRAIGGPGTALIGTADFVENVMERRVGPWRRPVGIGQSSRA